MFDFRNKNITLNMAAQRTPFFNTGSASFGIVARNRIYNGNAAHWFDDVKQIIFEHNTVSPGGAGPTWGNNIDNYSEGYCQHIFHAHNSFSNVWAGDRESMTFDPVNAQFNGLVQKDDGSTVTFAPGGSGTASDAILGGAAAVLAGTGAGQYRRIVALGVGTVSVDRPYDPPLDATSTLQLGPFKGRIIFHANEYVDGGSFQTYATAMDIVVSEHRFERSEGLLAWGRSGTSRTLGQGGL